jgi:hypothetical protein
MFNHSSIFHPAALVAGLGAAAAAALIAGCSSSANEPPSPSSTPTSTASQTSSAAPAPSEKSVSPTGGNLFTPEIKAPTAPSFVPGAHPGINGVP